MKKATLALALATITLLALASTPAMAALGGLTAAKTQATDIRDGIFALVGVLAGLYLIFEGVRVALDKIQWADFFNSAFKVAVIGGAIVFAAWLWTIFQ